MINDFVEPAACVASDATGPIVSALTVSWNGWTKLDACLTSLYAQKIPSLEVIVVDNGSTDGTPDRVAAHFSDVVLHRFDRNLGHTKALNYGFARARGRFVLVLDPDTVLGDDCIARLVAFLDKTPDAHLVAPRTFNTDGSIQETARNLPGVLSGLFGRQTTLTQWFPGNPISRHFLRREFLAATEPFEVEQIGGACMFFRRELLDEVGTWDEGYFAYWVDTDWCCRVRSRGYSIFCLPTAQMVHHESNARGKRKPVRRIWLFNYGAWRFYTRWRTYGVLDPRSVLAGVALLTRTAVQIAQEALRDAVRR
jgi:GT2 family glycosyltransferase